MELSSLVKYLIKVNPDSRPDCNQILNFPSIKAKIDLLFPPNYISPTESTLLKTIKFPKTNQFSVSLPQSNYKNEAMKLLIRDEPIISWTVPHSKMASHHDPDMPIEIDQLDLDDDNESEWDWNPDSSKAPDGLSEKRR